MAGAGHRRTGAGVEPWCKCDDDLWIYDMCYICLVIYIYIVIYELLI
jgi:hypothetical protein